MKLEVTEAVQVIFFNFLKILLEIPTGPVYSKNHHNYEWFPI